MLQIYTKIPICVDSTAQIIQFKDFHSTIQDYILYLLSKYDELSCTQISVLSVVPARSLTNAIQKLIREGRIKVNAFKRNPKTQRVVQVYALLSNSKLGAI